MSNTNLTKEDIIAAQKDPKVREEFNSLPVHLQEAKKNWMQKNSIQKQNYQIWMKCKRFQKQQQAVAQQAVRHHQHVAQHHAVVLVKNRLENLESVFER